MPRNFKDDPEYKARIRKRKRRLQQGRRQARIESGDLTDAQWHAILRKHSFRCATPGCGRRWAHLDHIIPLSKGGEHTASNVQPLCAECNLKKGAKILNED